MTLDESQQKWEEIKKKLKSGEIKVIFADDTYVKVFEGEIDEIIDALVGPKASVMVTDMSCFGDFDGPDGINYTEAMERVRKLGIDVTSDDLIYEAAIKLRKLRLG